MAENIWKLYQTTQFAFSNEFDRLQMSTWSRFAIISARNPLGQQQSLNFNQEAEKIMVKSLKKGSYTYARIIGCSPSLDYVEPSFLIKMKAKRAAIEIAYRYKQNALFWVCDDQLWLVPCYHQLVNEVNLGLFSKRLITI